MIAGRYRLLERIGSGGMADVFRARDERLRRDVALKLLRDGHAHDPEFLDRFRREARNAATVEHPNVATVYDFGEDGDDHFIVLELVEGPTLKEIVRARGALPEDEALTIGAKVARGLDAAHAKGVIHRDLKPHNVLVAPDGEPKIVDFGIAKGAGETQVTRTAAVLGTAHYFSPEQAKGERADARSDVYSLGALMYELLTGRVPFDGAGAVEIALKHLNEAPTPPIALRRGLRRTTNDLVMRALAKDPARRFQTASAFATAMAAARDGAGPVRGIAARPRSRAGLVAAAITGAVLLAGGVGLAGRDDLRAPAAAPPATALATVAAFTASPQPTASAAPSVARPTASPVVTARPAAATASETTPEAAVAEFYGRVVRRDFGGAAELWTARMRANWPPQTYIDQRFASTTAIQLLRNEIASIDQAAGRATVSVDMLESTSSGRQRWSGTWRLVRTPSGWLLDQPSLTGG